MTLALPKAQLGILDSTSDDVLELPAGSLVHALGAVCLAPLSFRLGSDTFGKRLLATSNTSGESDLKLIGNFVNGSQESVKILLVVG